MFTSVSTSYLSDNKIVEIKYDFITSEDKIAFSMGDINFQESTIEDFITNQNNEETNG